VTQTPQQIVEHQLRAVQSVGPRPRRIRPALGRWGRVVRARLVGPARMLPGVAAAGCAFAGAWLVWSLGVALLVAAGLLLLVDARTPAA
jgi:hypothetical protein